MENKLKCMAGRSITTTIDRRGHATISGDGLETLTVEPLSFEEGDYHVFRPDMPPLYASGEQEARALAVLLDARHEPIDPFIDVHWALETPAGDLLFADWSDVVLYAAFAHATTTKRDRGATAAPQKES